MKSDDRNASMKNELLSRGYTSRTIYLDRTYTQYFSKSGALVLTKAAYADYPFVSQFAKKVSKDKQLSYELAERYGVVTPETLQTTDPAKAKEFLRVHGMVIVKPPHLGGGKGISLNIKDEASLENAIRSATVYGAEPLIQRQFLGEEIRFTIIGGKVRSAFVRQKPRVIGDGIRSIAQLIADENAIRAGLRFPALSYPQLTEELIPESYLHDDRVAPAGEIIELSRATMIKKGASLYGILSEIHSSYIAIAEKLAKNVNPAFLVVDLMINDWRRPASAESYIFLEFNTSPALEMYTSFRGGDQPDIISMLADQIDAYVGMLDQGYNTEVTE